MRLSGRPTVIADVMTGRAVDAPREGPSSQFIAEHKADPSKRAVRVSKIFRALLKRDIRKGRSPSGLNVSHLRKVLFSRRGSNKRSPVTKTRVKRSPAKPKSQG